MSSASQGSSRFDQPSEIGVGPPDQSGREESFNSTAMPSPLLPNGQPIDIQLDDTPMEEGNPTVDEVVLLSSSGDPRFPGLPPGDDDIDIELMEQ